MPRPVGVFVESHGVIVHHGLEVFRIREVYLVELREVVGSRVAVDDVRSHSLDKRLDFLDRLHQRSFDWDSFRLLKIEDVVPFQK